MTSELKLKKIRPKVMENDSRASEHNKAKFWRLHTMHLSIDRLAELTGYTPRAIYLMELGTNSQGKRVKPWVWHRYKMSCCAVAALQGRFGGRDGLQRIFEWQP